MRVTIALTVLLVGAAGCGGDPQGRDVVHDDVQAVYSSFTDCMRTQGANVGVPVIRSDGSIEIPPGNGSTFSTEEELQDAAEACQPILAARGLPPPGPITLSEAAMDEIKGRSTAFAACLRTAGVDWPDPQWSGGAIVNWQDVDVDLDDPATKAVGESCVAKTGFDPLLAHAIADG